MCGIPASPSRWRNLQSTRSIRKKAEELILLSLVLDTVELRTPFHLFHQDFWDT